MAILGVGTAGDSTNRLAVRSNTALLTAIAAADGGTGDIRLARNKVAAGNTASVLFQTAFSGRAEFGLTGTDAFTLKVSPNGSSWADGFTIDAAGRFLAGVAAAVTVNGVLPAFQLHGPSTGGSALAGTRWSADAAGPGMYLCKSRSATVGSIGGPVQAGDQLARFIAAGDVGVAIHIGGEIVCHAESDWTSGSGRSAGWVFRTRNANVIGDRVTISAAGAVAFPSIATTAAAATAVLDGANQNNLLRSTSSARYKRDVEPVERARSDAILSLAPIWYRSTAPADRPDGSWYGLIAEDVAAVEPRLVHSPTTTTTTSSCRRKPRRGRSRATAAC